MESIRSAIEGASRELSEHPEAAVADDSAAVARRVDGLRFRVTGPNGDVVTDMSAAVGGGETAPSPGWMLRAALAACDASVVAMQAAREGVALTELEVTVTSESDFRGVLGVGDLPAGPLAVRTRIRLAASNAGEDELRAIAGLAESRSPVRDAVARAVPVTTAVEIA